MFFFKRKKTNKKLFKYNPIVKTDIKSISRIYLNTNANYISEGDDYCVLPLSAISENWFIGTSKNWILKSHYIFLIIYFLKNRKLYCVNYIFF